MVNTFKTLLLSLASLAAVGSSQAETRYITDNLKIYTRSGPTTAFRIIGAVNTGDAVTVLEVNEETQFTKIETADGKTHWIESDHLSPTPAARVRLAALENETASSAQNYQNRIQELESKSKENNELIDQIDILTQKVGTLETEKAVLTQQNQAYKNQFQQDFFLFGGGVAFVGTLIGFILSKFGGRKRRDLF